MSIVEFNPYPPAYEQAYMAHAPEGHHRAHEAGNLALRLATGAGMPEKVTFTPPEQVQVLGHDQPFNDEQLYAVEPPMEVING